MTRLRIVRERFGKGRRKKKYPPHARRNPTASRTDGEVGEREENEMKVRVGSRHQWFDN